MKYFTYISFILFLTVGCSSIAGDYGNTEWKGADAISTSELVSQLSGNDSVFATVTGEIKAACQAKGCWMTMDAAGEDMIIKFKDYGFFVPMNSAGSNATMQGWAYIDTLSVAMQQEYARDAEKTEEEIAEITEPQVKLSFTANGVVIL
jgi:hypothetical protein